MPARASIQKKGIKEIGHIIKKMSRRIVKIFIFPNKII